MVNWRKLFLNNPADGLLIIDWRYVFRNRAHLCKAGVCVIIFFVKIHFIESEEIHLIYDINH